MLMLPLMAFLGIPIGPVIAFGDPHRHKAAVDRDPEVGERVAQQDPVLAPAPTLMRLERRERSLGTFAEIIPEPLELEI